MWLKKLMAHEDRYVEFVGSMEVYNAQVFDANFVSKLLDDESAQFVFRYTLSSFVTYLRMSYQQFRMDLLKPYLILGIEKDKVFLHLKGGPKLPSISEEIVEIYSKDFHTRNFKNRYYQGVYDKKRNRLKFIKTNIIPNTHWLNRLK